MQPMWVPEYETVTDVVNLNPNIIREDRTFLPGGEPQPQFIEVIPGQQVPGQIVEIVQPGMQQVPQQQVIEVLGQP